jgi:hypothetical protein
VADSQVEIGRPVVYNHETDNENSAVLRATLKILFWEHVIELENRPWQERLLVDGKEVARFGRTHFRAPDFSGDERGWGQVMPPGVIYPSVVTIRHAGLERQSDALLEFPRIRLLKGKV